MTPKEFVGPPASTQNVLRLSQAAAQVEWMQQQQQQQPTQHPQQPQQQQQLKQQQPTEVDADDVELQRALEASLREAAASPEALSAAAPPSPRQLSEADFLSLLPEGDDLTDWLAPPPPRSSCSNSFPLSSSSSHDTASSKKLPEDRFVVPPEWISEEERRGCCCCCRLPDSCSSTPSSPSASPKDFPNRAAAFPLERQQQQQQQQQQQRWKCCACIDGSLQTGSLTQEEQLASLEASTQPLEPQRLRELLLLLVGEGSERQIAAEDFSRWMDHPIAFVAEWPKALRSCTALTGSGAWGCREWGLAQVHGGPCGVLAALQCFVLRSLLFSSARARRCQRHLHQPKQRARQGLRGLYPCALLRQHALAEAVSAVLFQCTDTSVYTVAVVSCGPSPATRSAASAADMDAMQCYTREIVGVEEVMRFYAAHYRVLLSAPGAALSLLASVVLTRGPRKVRNDMDPPARPLLGVYGHCAQEALNLLLQGAASSNVCDGSALLGEASLGGALKRPVVGFLSEMEVLRYCEVGSRFKSPRLPLWVIGSGNHYTALFATDPAAAELPSDALTEAEARWAFELADPGRSLLLQRGDIPQVLRALGLSESYESRIPSADEVVLYTDWLHWYKGYKANQAITNSTSPVEPPEAFHVFLYDGQIPPGPGVSAFLVNTKGTGAEGPQAGSLGPLLRTRWPAASVRSVAL
ncbi:ubiquitin carboxyl-terminal hydrolase MINDY-3 [Cyclospora cayetanensis]|uniref:Ubiquitin carboxyl-terminal hydrolase MINDY-3 n=1 Tax=Cyclospora cayetanensis TaxID=88456 RepID=A0A6P6RTH3_9EIME|nr:ubiquitin carboxyl-terminal hydrolase MINDY-3 [Cyclospora cayetanensis]